MSPKPNILVLSDLHLGEDLGGTATQTTKRNLEVMEGQLVAFLAHYAQHRRDGQPWRLVFNGDVVDFMTICVLPGERGLELARAAEEHTYGLRRREAVAVGKMAAVVERHRDVFRALARFVAAGNSLEVVPGNHDAEFHFPAVQQVFRDGVATIWSDSAASKRAGAITDAALREQIRFHAWFFHEPGVAWIEHGHQYDECSSFDFLLEPVGPGGETIATNVDGAGLRYVTNQVDDAEPHALAEWNFGGYLRFALGLGPRGMWKLARGYFLFVTSLLGVWRGYRPGSRESRRRGQLHAERLEALSHKWKLPAPSLRAIDELRRRPVTSSLRRLLSVLMVDRLMVALAVGVTCLMAFLLLSFGWALAASLGAMVLSRFATAYLHKKRLVDPEVTLALVPSRLVRHVDARFVVFGHTHEPVAQALEPHEDGRWYFNTGTWVPTGKPGLLRAFTHLVIRNGERGPSAELCQWRDGASRSFTPGWAPARLQPAPDLAPEVVAVPARA